VKKVWDAAGHAKESYVYDTNGNMNSSTSYNTAGTVVGGRQVGFDLLDRAVHLCAGTPAQCTGTPTVPVMELIRFRGGSAASVVKPLHGGVSSRS